MILSQVHPSRKPTISVLLPTYNSAATLGASIDSILAQTYSDFELLVLDDGSVDGTAALMGAYEDPRIRYLPSESNLRLSAQLNRGIDLAKGIFLARLDADDLAAPSRFSKQINYLETHPDVGICGSDAQLFDESGDREVWEYPADSDTTHAILVLRSSFLHPGVMMRKSVLIANGLRYDSGYAVAQDYELWYRMLKVTRGANLQETLTRYRISSTQLTRAQSGIKLQELRRIRTRILSDLGLDNGEEDLLLYNCLVDGSIEPTSQALSNASHWLNHFAKANRRTGIFPAQALERLLAELFWSRCQVATCRSCDGWTHYTTLDFHGSCRPKAMDKIKMLAKSAIKPSKKINLRP